MDSVRTLEARTRFVRRVLTDLWPSAVPLLRHGDCFELLVAVVLSAQTTDDQVNRVTAGLFQTWPDAERLAAADVGEVEERIRSLGFFRTKAKHLVGLSRILVERYGGRLPDSFENLLELPGVGRKTANLVASACMGRPGIIADTHFLRVCHRLGLIENRNPESAERRIEELVEPEHRTAFSHALNRHGKAVCRARRPDCPSCAVLAVCPEGRRLTGTGIQPESASE
ncbi:MAG TPA: endonuclease III [Magnetospirillaceae bacterium]|nr:endonuclease III [Magnetospirillaceae bacterium]